jgi:hypothetical protein
MCSHAVNALGVGMVDGVLDKVGLFDGVLVIEGIVVDVDVPEYSVGIVIERIFVSISFCREQPIINKVINNRIVPRVRVAFCTISPNFIFFCPTAGV